MRGLSALIGLATVCLAIQTAAAQPYYSETRDVGFQGLLFHEEYHAKASCPNLCKREGMRWTGRWTREKCTCERLSRRPHGNWHGGGDQWGGGQGGAWVRCSGENGICRLPYPTTVAYGANGRFTNRSFGAGTVRCNNATFGDPLVGVGKACFYRQR